MKSARNYFQPHIKWAAVAFFAVIVGIWLLFITGCAGPIIPKRVEASTAAFDEHGNQTAGVLKVWPGKGALLTESKKAEYDALVAVYGRGTEGHPLIPPVKQGDGLTKLRGNDEGFPLYPVVWHIAPEPLANFLLFKEWQRAGRVPLR